MRARSCRNPSSCRSRAPCLPRAANYRLHYDLYYDRGNPAELRWWWWCRCSVATVNYNTLLSLQSVLCSNLPFLSNQIHSFEQLYCIVMKYQACQLRIPETASQCSLARDKLVKCSKPSKCTNCVRYIKCEKYSGFRLP